jgi:signal transduction histidine kinase
MKRPGQDRRLRRRVIAVFLGAVMLPSLILAYLGLRYANQEEQWQKQLVLGGLKVTLANAAHKIEEDVHRAVLQVFDSLTSETSLPVSIAPQQLHKFLPEHALVEEVFVLDTRGRLLFPRTFRLQKAPAEVHTLTSSPVLRQQLIRGEEIEARGKYNDAIVEFTKGLNDCTSSQERLAFLVRIARCRHKAGDLVGAQQAYRRVLADDANQFLGEEVPYPVVASLQLAQIRGQRGEPAEAFDILARLYGNMVFEFHRFKQRQFEYYLARVRTELRMHVQHAGPVARSLLDSLSRIENVFLREPARADFLRAHVVPSIETVLLTRSERNSIRYLSIDDSDSSTHIAFRESGNGTRGMRIIGARLRCSYLTASVAQSLRNIHVGENLRVVLVNGKSTPEQPAGAYGTPVAEEPLRLLAGTMQGYRVALVGTQGTSIEEFTSRGVMPYYALIFAITVVIALGVMFIFHDISREQELTRMKSEFISNVTHEIKTPIATIRSLAENVNEGWVASKGKQQDYFRLIARESERLGHLVENTLDFSRIESGSKRYRMEVVSPQEVIERTVERFRTLTEGQKVEISYDLGRNLPPVRMDREAMGQALLNLLDNAAKYSRDRKIITVTAGMEDDQLKLSVADQGIGIEKRDIPRVFEKFYRAEARPEKNIAGSGIGLTLVKEIVEAHGGSISVESERNKGSTFTIHIPIKQRESNAEDSAG